VKIWGRPVTMCLPCFTEVFVEEELPRKKEEVLYTVWDGKARQYIKVPKSMVCNFVLSYDRFFPFPSCCLASISEGSVASPPILWSHIHFETREINNKQPRQHRVIVIQYSLCYERHLEPRTSQNYHQVVRSLHQHHTAQLMHHGRCRTELPTSNW